MRVAALDFGTVRIGVAVADELGLYAHPRPAIDAKQRVAALAAIKRLGTEEQITRWIVGIPLDPWGDEGPAAERARAFAGEVAQVTGCEVELWDERWSTVQAQRQMRASGVSARKQRHAIDSAAACVILQAWLDGQHTREQGDQTT